MTADVVPLEAGPYASWNDGLLALCDAMTDRHRLPAVLRRLERTAEQFGATYEDLCALALTVPIEAPAEPPEAADDAPSMARTLDAAKSEHFTPVLDRLQRTLEAIEEPIRRREGQAEQAFDPDDPRRILADTIWGLPAVALVDASNRLGNADPFRRLGARLGIWFQPSTAPRWMGTPLGEDVRGIRDLLRRLIRRSPARNEAEAAAAQLLRIVLGDEPVLRSAEALDLLDEVRKGLASDAAGVLWDSVLLALLEAMEWEDTEDVRQLDRRLAASLDRHSLWADDTLHGWTGSLTDWLQQNRKPVLLPDMSRALAGMCVNLREWPQEDAPATLATVISLLGQVGVAAYPQGPLRLHCYRDYGSGRDLPARLAGHLPEAHDLIRLLSLRSGDWAEAGGELGASFWGEPDDQAERVMDLRIACMRTLNRGDPALADMLLGGWLLFWLLGTRRPLPQLHDIACMIRRIPAEDRVSINAVIGLIVADRQQDAAGLRKVAALQSYLPPVPSFTPSDPEAELRVHIGDEMWGWLRDNDRSALIANETLFREWRSLGPAEAEMRRPARLPVEWAAVFEPLLRRALRRCDRRLAMEVRDNMTLGQAIEAMGKAWDLADDERWANDDPRRRHLIGEPWLADISRLNGANTRSGEHLSDAEAPGWHEVAALRARAIFGGPLRRALEAAGAPTERAGR